MKIVITLQAFIFKVHGLSQTCITSKSIMQVTETLSPDPVIFIEKEIRKSDMGEKVNFGGKKMYYWL